MDWEPLDNLVRLSSRILALPAALLILTDEGRLGCVAHHVPTGRDDRVPHSPLLADACRAIITSGRPLIASDLRNEPGAAGARRGRRGRADVVAFAGAPVVGVGGRVHAVLAAMDEQTRGWTEGEMEIVTILAAAAASEFDRGITASRIAEMDDCFESLLEQNPFAIFHLDAAGRLLSANRACETISGHRIDELVRMPLLSIVEPAARKRVRACVRRALRGRTCEIEIGVLPPDGLRLDLALVTSPIRVSGEVVGVYGMAQDITQRKRAERELRVSEERLSGIISIAKDAIISVDDAQRIILFNRGAEETFGYTADEVIGRSIDLLIPEAHRLHHRRHVETFLGDAASARRMAERNEVVALRKNGDVFPAEAGISKLIVGGSRILTVILRDVTERKLALEALRASEERYRVLFEDSRDAIYITDGAGRFIDVNESALELFGYRREEMVGLHTREFYARREDHLRLAQEIEAKGSVKDYHVTLLRKDGQKIHCLLSATVRRDAEGRPLTFQGIVHDITDRIQAAEELERSLSILQATLESTMDGILVIGQTGGVVSYNSRLIEMWRMPEDLLRGGIDEEVLDFILDQVHEGATFVHQIEELSDRPAAEVADTLQLRDGRTFECYSLPQRVGGRIIGRIWSFRDATERVAAERRLRFDALHDPLTGLANRALFTEQLSRLIQRGKRRADNRFAVLFLDLDRFKVVNDSLGHLLGDELLIRIARRLEQCVRPSDMVARLGGDEFTILLEDVQGVSSAIRVAERVCRELDAPFDLRGHEVFTSTSIGIAIGSGRYDRPEEVLRDADIAMYRAKAAGRARFEVFDSTLHTDTIGLLRLETDLRRAIGREEFELHYQPIVVLETGRIAGFEALVRWRHPERGLLYPDAFVPLAEETGLIVPLGWWVVNEACRQLRIWKSTFAGETHLTMSINLSGRQLVDASLVGGIQAALQAQNLEAGDLTVEITESVLMGTAGASTTTLKELKELGVRLSIDDFGTGYSSLSYLHRFPVDSLKIDRSFVTIGPNDDNFAIVQAIVALARNLGKEAVPEGIETREQLARLLDLECRLGQGNLFSPAVDPAAATALLEAWAEE